jgi:hypothetical protein
MAKISKWDWRHRNKTTTILGATSVPGECARRVAQAINSQTACRRP